ncbi:uroporphyrinogen-III synthase [Rothia aerolata]|uniref:uroporphyrinogen-III synthase n=1 Tax=Rothia aerolata TaxID=1812262 RepID=UPI00166F25F5|nr:uroporphyrinogen-III synthase [Rothia aerolata]
MTRSPTKAQALVGELLTLLPDAKVDCAPLQQAVYLAPQEIEPADFAAAWVTFSSANGVAGLACWAESRGTTLVRLLAPAKVASVGSATADALARHGVAVDFQPSVSDAAHLARELPLAETKTVVSILGATARPHLVRDLRARGAQVATAVVYDMADYPADSPLVAEEQPAGTVALSLEEARRHLTDYTAIAATAPSLLKKLVAGLPPHTLPPVVAIGATTAATARELGLRVGVSASPGPGDLARALYEQLRSPSAEGPLPGQPPSNARPDAS